jgi:thiosulfate dehydrogenase
LAQETPSAQQIWTVPEIGALPNNANGRLVRRGRDLITATYAYIGPEVADRAKRFAGNNLACGNCHLQAGTKKFGIPLFGLFGEFPRYSARSGVPMTIEDRLNSCMTRSMNGRALPVGAPEMQAMVAYIKFLSTGVAPGQLLPGMGTGKMPELDRPADPVRGERGYANACLTCHGPNGAGIRRSLPTTDLGYMVPPLWGSDSFNDGAGMARLITGRKFSSLQHAARRRLPEPAAFAGTGLGHCGLRYFAAAAAQSRPRQGFPRSFGKAGRHALRSLRRRL